MEYEELLTEYERLKLENERFLILIDELTKKMYTLKSRHIKLIGMVAESICNQDELQEFISEELI